MLLQEFGSWQKDASKYRPKSAETKSFGIIPTAISYRSTATNNSLIGVLPIARPGSYVITANGDRYIPICPLLATRPVTGSHVMLFMVHALPLSERMACPTRVSSII